MPSSLLVRTPGTKPQLFPMLGRSVTIGRDRDVDLALPHASVSRLHAAMFETTGGRWVIEDRASRNGTRVNGAKVTQSALRPMDTIVVGDVELRYFGAESKTDGVRADVWSTPDISEDEATVVYDQRDEPEPEVTIDRHRAIVRARTRLMPPVRLGERSVLFGGADGIGVRNPGMFGALAEIKWASSRHVLHPLRWWSPVLLEGERVKDPCELEPGDLFVVGGTEFVYSVPARRGA